MFRLGSAGTGAQKKQSEAKRRCFPFPFDFYGGTHHKQTVNESVAWRRVSSNAANAAALLPGGRDDKDAFYLGKSLTRDFWIG